MLSAHHPRRVLPPGVEQQVIFGIMWIRVGTLKLIRNTKQLHHVFVQFWGQQTPVKLQTRHDLAYNSQKRLQQYDIKIPITYFAQYLEDMALNLKLEVQGIGNVTLDMKKFLRKNITIKDRYVFDHFKGAFEVLGHSKRKMGSLQIQMASDFYPQVALKELGQQAQQQFNCQQQQFSQKKNKQLLSKAQGGQKIKVDRKQSQEDNRIANSLNTNVRDNNEFKVDKYLAQQQEISQNNFTKKQSQKSKESKNQDYSLRKNFPTVQKILTYEDLRIDLPEHQIKNQTPNRSKKAILKKQSQKQINSVPISLNQINQPIQLKQNDIVLNQQFYGQHAGTFGAAGHNKIERQEPRDLKIEQFSQKGNRQKSKRRQNYIQQRVKKADQSPEKAVLSRVVNLQQQLAKSQVEITPIVLKPRTINRQQLQNPQQIVNQDLSPIQRPKEISLRRQPTYQNSRKVSSYPITSQIPEIQNNTLLLNMLVKCNVNTIKIKNSQQRMQIVYRPYGQKERVKLGPNFKNPLTIICPISYTELVKMQNVPFIIQFWEFTTNKFLGVVKIDLRKIHKGFIFEGKVNQMAIKTNIIPTTIHDGQVRIQTIKGESVGSMTLYAGIGTSNQIDTYQNNSNQLTQTQKVSNQQKIKQNVNENKQVLRQNQKFEATLQLLDEFILFLDAHNKQIFQQIMNLQSKNTPEFQVFLKDLKQIQENTYDKYSPLIGLFSHKSQIFIDLISDSYDDFKRIFKIAQNNFIAGIKKQSKNIKKLSLQKILKNSTFNVISKDKLSQILVNDIQNKSQLEQLLSLLKGNLINAEDCIEIFSGKHNFKRTQEFLSDNTLDQAIQSYILDIFYKNDEVRAQTAIKMFGNTVEPINIDDLISYLHQCGVDASIWLGLHLIEIIKKTFDDKVGNFRQIKFISVYNWLILSKERFKEKQNQQQFRQAKQLNERNKKKPSSDQNKLADKQNSISQSNLSQNIEKSQIGQLNKPGEQSVQKQIEQNKKPMQQHQQEILQREVKPFKHIFRIEPFQLSVTEAFEGECLITYNFPFQQQWINSKAFTVFPDKYKYPVKMAGQHSFSIRQPIADYLGDNAIKFTVKINSNVELIGAVHPDQIIISDSIQSPQNQQIKVIPLYGQGNDSIAGKIRYRLIYSIQEAKEDLLSKQTTYNLFLAKTGFINYEIQCKIDYYKIRQQLNLKEDFYLAVVLDLFWESQNLKTHFPVVSSKLLAIQNASNNKICLAGGTKIVLDPVILDYIKTKNAKASLNVIYYSKQRGNYQRKQITFASMTIPLIQVIKKNGIQGDYAFKNKLGMFAALANCIFSYDKTLKAVAVQPQQSSLQKRDNYWILMHFQEFINFQPTQYNSIRCEFVHHGKRYATEKMNLRGQAYHQLQGSSILVHMNQQQFQDLKVIPLSLVLGVQKFAVDIDVNSLSRNIGRQRYSIGNQYFLVVDQTSKIRRMRLGLKICLFRGSYNLGNFVDALNRNLHEDILSQMQLPAQLDNYDKLINIFKKSLKLGRKFDESYQEIVPRKRDQLPLEFFSNQPYPKLDFTPIFSNDETQIANLCEDLPTEVDADQLFDYIKQNNILMSNLRKQFLNRYTFSSLNKSGNCQGLDKNIRYFGLNNEVDLITFVRKIKSSRQSQVNINQSKCAIQNVQKDKQLRITLVRGQNLHELFNGIKPNIFLVLPQLKYKSNSHIRSADPQFNQTIRELMDQQKLKNFKKLKIQAYHQGSGAAETLIGQGYLDIKDVISKIYSSHRFVNTYKVALESTFSNRKQGFIHVKVQIGQVVIQSQNRGYEQSQISEDDDNSRDLSRIGNIIKEYKNEMISRDDIFQSSDDEY